MFWLTSDPARHATIYAGGGMVITTEAYGGRVGIVPMEAVDPGAPMSVGPVPTTGEPIQVAASQLRPPPHGGRRVG